MMHATHRLGKVYIPVLTSHSYLASLLSKQSGIVTHLSHLFRLKSIMLQIFRLFFLALLFFSPIIPKIMLTIFMIPAHNLHTMYRFHCL